MLSTNIALASKAQVSPVSFAELTHVANALSLQVANDVAPIWGIQAVVQAFERADQIPPGYWPIFVVDPAQMPQGAGGFHLTKHKQPYAEVESGTAWSLSASHELIEMLVDPSGNRLVAGPELTANAGTIGEDATQRVEYLVEACDPCEAQAQAYLIQDVIVSDFFTPHFHDTVASAGTRYSFTGALTRPRQVLPGGYISWMDPSTNDMMQLQYLDQTPRIINLTTQSQLGTESLREFVNRAEAAAAGGAGVLSRLSESDPLFIRRNHRSVNIREAARVRAQMYV